MSNAKIEALAAKADGLWQSFLSRAAKPFPYGLNGEVGQWESDELQWSLAMGDLQSTCFEAGGGNFDMLTVPTYDPDSAAPDEGAVMNDAERALFRRLTAWHGLYLTQIVAIRAALA